ncbi:uncharacterized protein [Gossypium hirsutum]|uniref:Uncharacterized protein n=1 Tax=Gossypium hirsutum TaxID=3635 RepID=A0A1U8KID3_GOSHI|nr:uncharacterized protein LOC107917468 [Gossypium hirsutum]
MCDLGASMNLMPMSVFRNLGIEKARPTTVTLQLAGRSYAHPEVKIEDVPFLAASRTLNEVQKGELTIRVNDQQITFNIFDTLKCANENEECLAIGSIEIVVEEEFASFCHNNSDSDTDSLELDETKTFEEFSESTEAK